MPLEGMMVIPSRPRVVLQIAHGMCEHKERYLPFMRYMAERGYLCVIHDHRGHGASRREAVSADADKVLGKKQDIPAGLGYFGKDGGRFLVRDLHQITRIIKKQYPGLPYFMMGHSMGSLAVRCYLKKYDRESNTRIWEGTPKLVIRILMAIFAAYCIVDTVFLNTLQEIRLPVFVGMILLIGFLTFPARKGDTRVNHMPWYDIVLLVVGPGAYFFYAVNAEKVIRMSARVMQNHLYMIVGLIAILALVELCRRCVGLPILCVAGVLLVYTFVNLMGTNTLQMTFYQVIRTMFYTTNGIFGGPINVCAKFIVVFIIFGAFLERTGIANFFISLANAVAGAAPGGPAKVAVISSALCGMVSGSSVGNTVTTGSVTIPMMKKTGYKLSLIHISEPTRRS